jgi:electron transport complex protein RnfG
MSDAAFTPPPEPHPVRLAGTLGLAGLLSGLLLVFAYEATLPMIEQNRAEAVRRAVFEVVPGSSAMQKLVWQGDALVVADGTEAKDAQVVYAAYDERAEFRGYAIPGAGAGFQDTIALIFGYDPGRERIVGIRVLESRETPGLGDKIDKTIFRSEFEALAVEPKVVAVKAGTATQDNEVDAITGATISSKAVVRIVNDANAQWLERLPAPGAEPPLTQQGGDR